MRGKAPPTHSFFMGAFRQQGWHRHLSCAPSDSRLEKRLPVGAMIFQLPYFGPALVGDRRAPGAVGIARGVPHGAWSATGTRRAN